jgi:hypothetical protein
MTTGRTGHLWRDRHEIGTHSAMTHADFGGIVDADEGGGLSPTLLKGGGCPPGTAVEDMAG